MKRNHLNALCFGLIIPTFYKCRNTEALKCDPHTGPNGVKHCIKLPQFNDFQWSTCRTDLYIRAKTGGKHHCTRRDITYCYYQCMLNVYGENGGDVYGSCRCSPDLNECVLGTHGCSVNGFCTNTSGSYTCQCNPGYTGNGFTCIDLNECVLGTHGCSVNGFCTNTFGSHMCQCNPGYTGNGFTCTDLNECVLGTHGCSVNGFCINTFGSYTCQCNPGYTGNGFTCIGVPDENPKSSSKSNTGVIIGTVAAAVIVIVAAIFIVGCFLFGRLKKQRRRDIGPIQNAAYEGDRHADIMPQVFHSESRPPAYSEIGLPQVFYSQSDYGQPAKYHSSTTVSIGANFQSANEAYPNQHHRAHNENAQRDAPHNLNSNPANESMYEEVS